LKQLLLELSRQRKDYQIKSRDIPLIGQALMHAVSTIMTSLSDDDKSAVWNDSLMLAWQQVIDAISLQVIGSTASTTSSTRRTRTCGGKPNRVVNNTNSTERSTSGPVRRLQPSPSMPLRQPLRQPSLPEAQGYQGGENEIVLWTRERAPGRITLSPSLSFRNKKSSSRHHRRHQPASAARVLVTKTTTTTTTTYQTTTATAMSDSSSVDSSMMNVEYNQEGSKRFNDNNNSFVSNINSNEKTSASFEAMNYTTTTMDSDSRHHTSSSLQASMGSYTEKSNMGRVSTSRQLCNFNLTKSSSSFAVIPQAYFVVFPPLENDDGSCSGSSFGAIEAVPETLLMHASSPLLLPRTQHASNNNYHHGHHGHHHHHHPHPSSYHSFNIGNNSHNKNSGTTISRGDRRLLTRGGSMMKKQPPVRVSSARKLYIAS
jgi:hypothetical protein